MKLIFALTCLFLLTFNLSLASDLKASFKYIASSGVNDLIYDDFKLYAGTSKNLVNIFDTKTKKLIQTIKVPKVKDFMGDEIDAKIYSLDVHKNKILITAQGNKGYRKIYLYTKNKLELIISDKKKLYIKQAKFINENTIIFALLSNQVFLYSLKDKKVLWDKQISQSSFSHFILNEDKTTLILSDESGNLKQINVKDGKIIKTYVGLNVDNVYQLDFKNDLIITAGKDRRCAVFNNKNSISYYKKASFLIYSVGLSPSGKIAGFANDEDNNITIFNTNTKEEYFVLKGHKSTLTNIVFINENELYSSSDTNEILYWKIN